MSREHRMVPEPPFIYDSQGRVRHGVMKGPEADRVLRIPKVELAFIKIDHQTRLRFESTEVVIEAPFVVQTGDATHHLDPSDRAGLAPLLALLHDVLEDATVSDSATLLLTFASGATITVAPDFNYEAWEVNGPDNYLVVCTPGADGNLAVWE